MVSSYIYISFKMIAQAINNVKISYKLRGCGEINQVLKEFAQREEGITFRDGNFFVFRSASYVYTIFYNGHVNATGLSSTRDIEDAQRELLSILDQPRLKALGGKVDNITSSGSLPGQSRVNLIDLARRLKTLNIKFRFNPHKFPGLSLKLERATFIVFTSGKFVQVGSRSVNEIRRSTRKFHHVFRSRTL